MKTWPWEWLAVGLLTGCTGLENARRVGDPEGIRLTHAELAGASGLPPWSLRIPFGAGQDGTALVGEFLREAERAGAHYVTDMELVFGVEDKGEPMECRTRIALLRPGAAPEPARPPSAGETRPELVPETRQLAVMENTCQWDQEWHSRPVSHTTMTYDSFSKSYRTSTETRMEGRWEPRYNCHPAFVTRSETRYNYPFRAGFTPPLVDRVVTVLPESWRAVETAPECHPREAGAPSLQGLPHRIEGRVYGCEAFRLPPDVDRPVEEMSRAERLRHDYRQKALAQREAPHACPDRMIPLTPAPGPTASGEATGACRVPQLPPAVDKPVEQMSRAERLRHEYRRHALAAGRTDCAPPAPRGEDSRAE